MKSWLHNNGIEMYSIRKKGKSIIAERYIRTLESKIFKYMTATSKYVYMDQLDEIVNNTYHRTIKMKLVML